MPIYATREVMQSQSAPYVKNAVRVPLPINVLSDKMIEEALEKAIQSEDYEMASSLRDELKKRHSDHQQPDGGQDLK